MSGFNVGGEGGWGGAGAIYCCMILAKIFLGLRAISSLHFWHPHFLLQLVLTAHSGTLTQPV